MFANPFLFSLKEITPPVTFCKAGRHGQSAAALSAKSSSAVAGASKGAGAGNVANGSIGSVVGGFN
jgi:hypothetical protein